MTSGKTNPIVFFGTEDFSATALQALIDADYTIVAVVTKPDTKRGRGQKIIEPIVKTIATRYGIDVWQPGDLDDIIEPLTHLHPVTGVLVSFGRIIPPHLLALFTPGIINVHPSLLPAYRGPSPIETALLRGDHHTGVTIMKLVSAMDAGPIYAQHPFPASITAATQPQLYNDLGKFGAELLVASLPGIITGEHVPAEQDHAAASYCQLIQKSDGVIDWKKPAVQLEREIRAYKSWPQSRTIFGDVECIITGASTTPHATTRPGMITISPDLQGMHVATANGSLHIESIKPVGKKEMPIQAFLAGYRHRLLA